VRIAAPARALSKAMSKGEKAYFTAGIYILLMGRKNQYNLIANNISILAGKLSSRKSEGEQVFVIRIWRE